jgi:carboxypeptidase PM20D1
MKKLLLLIGTAVVLTAAFTVVLTARYVPTETPVPPADEVAVPSGATERLAYAIRIATISPEDERAFDAAAFADLHAYLQSAFPRVHSALQRETVAKHSSCIHGPATTPR